MDPENQVSELPGSLGRDGDFPEIAALGRARPSEKSLLEGPKRPVEQREGYQKSGTPWGNWYPLTDVLAPPGENAGVIKILLEGRKRSLEPGKPVNNIHLVLSPDV